MSKMYDNAATELDNDANLLASFKREMNMHCTHRTRSYKYGYSYPERFILEIQRKYPTVPSIPVLVNDTCIGMNIAAACQDPTFRPATDISRSIDTSHAPCELSFALLQPLHRCPAFELATDVITWMLLTKYDENHKHQGWLWREVEPAAQWFPSSIQRIERYIW